MTHLKKIYEAVCLAYVKEFAKKQDIEFVSWADCVGGTALFGCNLYVKLRDIVHDIETNQPVELIFDYDNHVTDEHSKGNDDPYGSYENYCREHSPKNKKRKKPTTIC